jgi:hypothetical protein
MRPPTTPTCPALEILASFVSHTGPAAWSHDEEYEEMPGAAAALTSEEEGDASDEPEDDEPEEEDPEEEEEEEDMALAVLEGEEKASELEHNNDRHQTLHREVCSAEKLCSFGSYGKKLRAVECSVLVARMFLFLVSQTNDTCLNSSKSDYKL